VNKKAKPDERVCTKCGKKGGRENCGFRKRSAAAGGGNQAVCWTCENEQHAERRDRRITSDYEALKASDFDVTVANDRGRTSKKQREEASKEKRQEWSVAMGEFAERIGRGELTEADGQYIGALSEQERRFGNRRLARSISLYAAHEALARRQFKQVAEQYFSAKIKPTGYAVKPHRTDVKRTVVLALSDLHFGAELDARDNPMPYRAVEEARRFEYVIRQALDYKPQYRKTSRLVVLLNGDLIEGMLLHDLRAGAPLTEQKAIFWMYLRAAMGLLAQVYPEVQVECQPGNHGRDKLRHPGRASEFKWDGIEWQMYFALRMMCSELKNITWSLPFRAVGIVDLHGANLLVTHGDTEVAIADPDTQAAKNAAALDKINSSRIYGCEFQVATFGHWHKSRNQGGGVIKIFNGCLVPPNGHARGKGYIGEPCSQTIWEAVEGHPVGDYRRIEVGKAQDDDERLGKLIPPFRLDAEKVAA
jgi:hypothetical protein